ncbi:MAG TPA: hypothetical protein VFB42_12325 [Gaiellaceae bacterium]|nr:hypothetical protein [Gaiellaceae bacterium]
MKAKTKVQDAAENLKPYVERAMADEKLRDDVMRAFGTAREIYKDLMGEKSAVTIASRVATDDDIRDRLRAAIEDLRNASDRLQGRKEHSARTKTLLVAGIALGLLFNPITGPETRRFIKDMLSSGDEDRSASSSNGSGR